MILQIEDDSLQPAQRPDSHQNHAIHWTAGRKAFAASSTSPSSASVSGNCSIRFAIAALRSKSLALLKKMPLAAGIEISGVKLRPDGRREKRAR